MGDKKTINMLVTGGEANAGPPLGPALGPLGVNVLGVVNEINSPNLKLLYDIYHMQIMSGNIIQTLRENIGSIGHIHCAGVPGRHELYMGELNYRNIFKTIDELKYDGYVGLEYFPTLKSEESLKRVRELAET